MSFVLILAFMFFIGSMIGWVIELFFRRFYTKNNPERRWVNPGFLNGPYLPVYGFGLCALYSLTMLEGWIVVDHPIVQKLLLFLIMAAAMTVIEYIAGVIFIKGMKTKLWDYSNEWANFQGIICPKFSFFWALLSAVYYFLVHPRVLNGIRWLSENLAFSFFIGLFFGVFLIDVVYSLNLIVKIRSFAAEHEIVVRYERLKEEVQLYKEEQKNAASRFLLQFRSERPLKEVLEAHLKHYKK